MIQVGYDLTKRTIFRHGNRRWYPSGFHFYNTFGQGRILTFQDVHHIIKGNHSFQFICRDLIIGSPVRKISGGLRPEIGFASFTRYGYGSRPAYTLCLITAASRRRLLALAFASRLGGPFEVSGARGFSPVPALWSVCTTCTRPRHSLDYSISGNYRQARGFVKSKLALANLHFHLAGLCKRSV